MTQRASRATSSPDRYGTVARWIHWVSVVLILAMMATGNRAASSADPDTSLLLLRLHVPVGLLVFALTLGRIVWWWRFDTKPAAIPMPGWQARAAHAVHVLFYVVILGMGASGVGMLVLSGAGNVILGGATSALPDFWTVAPRTPHGLGARAMAALIVFHVGAALYHHVVLRDGLLRRMG